jgi:hypothetical protein
MKNQVGKKGRFWTGARIALACAAFGGVAIIASNCKSNDTANLAANNNAPQAKRTPQITISSKQGSRKPRRSSKPSRRPPGTWRFRMWTAGSSACRTSKTR